ncbi:methyl-accepting chemotaxis protein [Ferrovibrio xuzhouensis]|uniref:Methyl-accepting chemotaxis protein n=1 Tax=Ferrovibrio xuzhouensis TaxID=1576914 RepID=A0ABV7VDT5_9PROT
MSIFARSRHRSVLQAIDDVCGRAAAGDLSARIVDTESHGAHAETARALNRLLDRTDAFIRESGAALTYAAAGKYFRPFLLRGMTGDFRRGAEITNRARQAMHDRADAATRLERQVAEQRAAMEEAARAERQQLADQFEREVMSIVEAVQESAQTLHGNAATMSHEIEAVHGKADSVAAAAHQSTTNAQAVAAAAEQLSASVSEVSRQVTDARTASRAVTEEVARASDAVQDLATANRKIDEVVEFIKGVAFQTNLLALNASVEAARAGEAGKGFAVVAQEVRHLAQKTAEAAKSIADQIGAIQRATDNTVNAIAVIRSQADTLNERVGTMTESMQEQSGATVNISDNIQDAAAGIESVSSNVHEISAAAGTAGAAAASVSGAVDGLNGQAAQLGSRVRDFLDHIRRL